MKILDLTQGSDDWLNYRIGKPTASNFGLIVTSTGKKSSSWDKYAYKCAYETLTGNREESYKSDAMQRGIDLEPEARSLYELITGNENGVIGIVTNDAGTISCSPDALYGKTGLEIKCPNPETHIKYIMKGVVPTDYKPQVYGCLWLCDAADCWDFFSYHPDMKHFLIRTDKDDKGYKVYAEAMEKYMPEFLKDVEQIIEKIK